MAGSKQISLHLSGTILPGYENQWLALRSSNNQIIGSGTTLHEAAEEARRQGHTDPVFFKVPPAGYFTLTSFSKKVSTQGSRMDCGFLPVDS